MTLALYRGRGQVWQRQGDPIPPPPGSVTVPYIGFTTDSSAQFTGMCGQVGQLLTWRTYNNLATGVPASWSVSAAKNDPALGVQISYLSIKTDMTAAASGGLDAALTAFAKTMPAGAYLSWWPEGEAGRHNGGSGYPAATFAAALKRVYQVMKSANSQINVGPCYMTYSLTSGHGFPLDNWYNGELADSGDFISWDGYNETVSGWKSFEQIMAPAVAWSRARSDLPILVAETGSVADPSNAGRRKAWWQGVYDYATTIGMPIVCGWQGGAFPQYDVYPGDVAALSAISTLNTDTKAARA